MKPLLKPSSINFCSPHCVFFYVEIFDVFWGPGETLKMSPGCMRFCSWAFDCLRSDCNMTTMRHGAFRSGVALFFFLLFLGSTSRGRWSPCFESGNCRKKKNWIRPASQPVNSRWIWVVVQLVLFWKLHSAQDCCLAIRSAFLLVRKLRKPEIFGEASSVKLWLVSWGVEIWFLLCEHAWIY